MGPEQVDALEFLAHVLLQNGRWNDALPLYEALVALDGRDRRRRQALSYALLRTGKPREALAHLDWCMAQTDEPPEASLVLLRARALWDSGRQDEAREFLAHPERAAGGGW